MTVGVLVVTHDNIGAALMETAMTMLGVCPIAMELLSVSPGCQPEDVILKAEQALRHLDQGDGVLVLTDMYGSTPSNVANRLVQHDNVLVVAGINLPMLIRVLNYPQLGLQEMASKATSGGRDGIFICECERSQNGGANDQ